MLKMGKKLLSSLSAQFVRFKVMCGLSLDPAAKEEKAVLSVTPEPIPSYRFLHTLHKKKTDKHLNIEVRVSVPYALVLELIYEII